MYGCHISGNFKSTGTVVVVAVVVATAAAATAAKQKAYGGHRLVGDCGPTMEYSGIWGLEVERLPRLIVMRTIGNYMI
jgi:hypothetical protein